MGLKVAIQMDPIGGINIAADSTFRIMEEAQARGHTLFYYTPDRLSFRMGRILARGWPVTVRRVVGDHFTLGEEAEIDLATQDVVWLRQDPPFDMGYITTTHILEHLMPGRWSSTIRSGCGTLPRSCWCCAFPSSSPTRSSRAISRRCARSRPSMAT
jgi:glutathione synthase